MQEAVKTYLQAPEFKEHKIEVTSFNNFSANGEAINMLIHVSENLPAGIEYKRRPFAAGYNLKRLLKKRGIRAELFKYFWR